MRRHKIFIETSVALKVGTRDLPHADWYLVVQYLAPNFEFVVSPLSFIEVLNSLARGDERFVIPNRKRLEALSPLDSLNPIFLEMPGQFVLREVLGTRPVLKTYQPEPLREVMITILKHSSVSPELRAFLDEIKHRHEFGICNYTAKYDEVRTIGQTTPDRELWVRAHLTDLGIRPSAEDVVSVGSALDAAYEYSAWIRRQLVNSSYLPSKEASAWIDPQQLFYLCDLGMHMLYVDGDFTERTGTSSQQSRLIKLGDVMAEMRGEPLIES